MTDDRYDEIEDETIRNVLAATGDRPTDEFRAELRQTLRDTAAGRTTTPTSGAAAARRSMWPLAAAAALVIVLVAAVLAFVVDRDGDVAIDPPDDGIPLTEALDSLLGRRLVAVTPANDGRLAELTVIAVDGRRVSITGSTPCNDVEGSIELDPDGTVVTSTVLSTLVGCDEAVVPAGPGDRVRTRIDGIDVIRGDVTTTWLALDALTPATRPGELVGTLSWNGAHVLDLFADDDTFDDPLSTEATFGTCSLGWTISEPGRFEFLQFGGGPDPSDCHPLEGVPPELTEALATATARLWVVDDATLLVTDLAHTELLYRLERDSNSDTDIGDESGGALDTLVGEQLVIAGAEYGPAVQLRIRTEAGGVLVVDGIDECNGYDGTVTIDEDGVVTAADLAVNANECSGPPSSGTIRPGDVLRAVDDGLVIERDGDEFRLVSLDAIGAITDPGEIDALGEIRVGGRRARFGEPGVVEVDGCELAWTMDAAGVLTAVDGNPNEPLCAGAEPDLIAYAPQDGGVTFHRNQDGMWVRSIGRDTAARVVIPPAPGTALTSLDDLVGIPLVALDVPPTSGPVGRLQIAWRTDDRVRLLLDVGCQPEEIELRVTDDEVSEIVRGPFVGDCEDDRFPRVGDRLTIERDGLRLDDGDRAVRFTWIDALAPSAAVPAGDYLLDGERVTFDDATVTANSCPQTYGIQDGIMTLPLRDTTGSCSGFWNVGLSSLLAGGVTVRHVGPLEFLLEHAGTVGLLVPDSGAPFAPELQGIWFLERDSAPPELSIVAPSLSWTTVGDVHQIVIFDGCSRAAYEIVLDDGTVSAVTLLAGASSCPDADVPFEPIDFRVGDRLRVESRRLLVVAPNDEIRFAFTNNPPGSGLRADLDDLLGPGLRRSWRPAGSDAEAITFSIEDGRIRVEYGRCSSLGRYEGVLVLDDWPTDPTECVDDDAAWVERTVAEILAVDGAITIWGFGPGEIHLDGDRVVRLVALT